MRKILISVLVVLMLIASGFFMVKGFASIKGAKGIGEKDDEINGEISELANIISVTYKEADSNLKQATNKLIDSKTEYENQAALSNSHSSSYASKLESYDIDYLWTKLGNYAKDENVVIKIDVTAGGESSNLYNLNFTVIGTYVGATDFIYDIENDSKLGFKIDNFKMTAGSGTEVTASFVCQDIPLSVGNIETTSDETTTGTDTKTTDKNKTTENKTTNQSAENSTSKENTTSSSTTSEYGISDPNKSNLTSIDQVIN